MTGPTPGISVIIPAYNESASIRKCVVSVLANHFANKQVIVVDDGSTDDTWQQLQALRLQYSQLQIVHHPNGGKASAINLAIVNYATEPLVMVLDADSTLHPDALAKMSAHFRNPRVVSATSNVGISSCHNLVEFAQRLEYMLTYHLKGSDQLLRMIYLVGGVASTFRRDALMVVHGYDRHTMTEDLDVTMKLINLLGNRYYRFIYAQDVIAETPACHSLRDLITQRLRWKTGLVATMIKFRHLFFCRPAGKYSRTLVWWKLPKVVLDQIQLLINPLLFIVMVISLTQHFAWVALIVGMLLYLIFVSVTALVDLRFTNRQRLSLCLVSPIAGLILLVSQFAEFCGLAYVFSHLALVRHRPEKASWVHVAR